MKPKPIKIFTVGGATFDMFIRANEHAVLHYRSPKSSADWLCLGHGAKVGIDEVHETFGGGATNTAVAFSRFGFSASFVGKIGSEYGDRVLKNLTDEGVDITFARKTSKDKTGFSTILNTFEGDRTVLAYPGANRFFTARDLPLEAMSRTDWIFLNHLSEPSSKIPGEILRLLKKHPSVRLAWNPGKEQFTDGIGKWKDLLAHTDVLFLNKEEAAQFSGIPYHPAGMKSEDPKFFTHIKRGFLPPYADDVSDILHAFLKTGVKNVVITDGGNGSQATDSRRLYFCPVLRHKRVDSTGAGDAFASGFTAGLMLGKTVKDCLGFGTINAYHVIQQFGAQKGLLTLEAMESEAKTLDICVESTKLN